MKNRDVLEVKVIKKRYLGWIKKNIGDVTLKGKKVAVTGSTGGLGGEICEYLAYLGADLVLLDRNSKKSEAHAEKLKNEYTVGVDCISCELEDMASVDAACDALIERGIDIIIHNAGAYSIPRKKCSTGYDNVFQINFLSPYYMTRRLLPMLSERGGRVVIVGSIAHDYSRTDKGDVDFSTRKAASKLYGNAKRYLMFSMYELFRGSDESKNVSLSVTHPGITVTNITAHYPKLIYAIIKYPMKLIFMDRKKAALSILSGAFESCGSCEWIGPRGFDVWGYPKKKKLNTVSPDESKHIGDTAEMLWQELENRK